MEPNFVFWFVVALALALAAVCITQVIMKPIKRRKSDRDWKKSKAYWQAQFR